MDSLNGTDWHQQIEIERYHLIANLDLAVLATNFDARHYVAGLRGKPVNQVTEEEAAFSLALFRDLRAVPSNEIFRGCYCLGYPDTDNVPPDLKVRPTKIIGIVKPKDELSMFLSLDRVEPGLSGGPLISSDGIVIGVVCYADFAENAVNGLVVTALSPEKARAEAVRLGGGSSY